MRRYSPIQRLLHWLIAALVIGALTVGLMIDEYGFKGLVDSFGQDTTNLIYKYHKTFGIIILSLMLVRVIVRLSLGKPEYATPLTKFERIASEATHGLLYVLLIAMPLLGWMASSAGGFPAEFFNWKLPALLAKDEALSKTLFGLHGLVGNLIILLILLHVGAALRHAFIKKDGVIRRML